LNGCAVPLAHVSRPAKGCLANARDSYHGEAAVDLQRLRRQPSGQLGRLLAADEGEQTLMVLAAGRAAVKVGTQAGDDGVDVLAFELELDVAVELVEAHIAPDLRPGGA
jgi:hypothetical protein